MSKSLKTEEIKKYFADREEFSSKELYEFYTFYESDLNKNTFRWRVHNLKEIGAIKSSRHGYYYVEKEEEKKNYIVLTADIINSKKNDYRNMKNEIEKNLKDLNGKYKSILKGFTISQGDEIQGLLDINEEFPAILRELRYRVFPCLLRVAIGIGAIENEEDIKDDLKTSWAMNGQAFFRAREGMDLIENEKKTKTKFVGFEIDGIGVDLVSILNNTYDLMDGTIDEWNKKKWDAVQLYYVHRDLKSVAENLQEEKQHTISGISQRLRYAKAKLVFNSEKIISACILKFK